MLPKPGEEPRKNPVRNPNSIPVFPCNLFPHHHRYTPWGCQTLPCALDTVHSAAIPSGLSMLSFIPPGVRWQMGRKSHSSATWLETRAACMHTVPVVRPLDLDTQPKFIDSADCKAMHACRLPPARPSPDDSMHMHALLRHCDQPNSYTSPCAGCRPDLHVTKARPVQWGQLQSRWRFFQSLFCYRENVWGTHR